MDWDTTSIEQMIERAGWWPGTAEEWRRLPMEERERRAFEATGCEVAFCTWQAPVDCVHVGCQIRRGELPQIARCNSILRGEKSNYFRFALATKAGRKRLALIFRALRNACVRTGEYDPWKVPDGWQVIVGAAFGEICS